MLFRSDEAQARARPCAGDPGDQVGAPLVACHQLGLDPGRVFTNVEKYGNTAAASVPIAICEAVESGRLLPGHRVVMVAAGSGMSYAALAAQWAAVPSHQPAPQALAVS